MKRDIDLIRELLLFYESDGATPFPSHDNGVINQHLILLIEAGLLDGNISNMGIGSPQIATSNDGRIIKVGEKEYVCFRVTWLGHDFITTCKDDNLWKKAKSNLGSAIVGMTLEMVKEYIQIMIKERLGLS